ncbi:hypothetical protein GCM10009737_04580 [Nocardioides lentus]|uniref:Uncharacterized protein n=1 Tax=Nocardioides lentus TaxID=338077 RepID=A0ABP5A8K3_9ACTN
MLRSILNQVRGAGRRRPAAGGTTTPGARRPTGGGSANAEIAQGAKSLFRGLSRKRRR